MDNQEERLAIQSVPVHHLPAEINDFEGLYFPINHLQLRNLLGQVLTQVEAMVLPPQSEKATKAIFTQMLWRWFDDVMDNSVTSSRGCIAPIKVAPCMCDGIKEGCTHCTVKPPIKVFRFPKEYYKEPTGRIPGGLAEPE